MSQIILTKVATPPTPAATKGTIYIDTADYKLKLLDPNGLANALTYDGWRDRPLVANSAFEYWQRQAPGTLTTYSSVGGRVYTADRWCVSNENASIQAIRTDTEAARETGLASRYYGTWSKITSTGKLWVGQVMPSDVAWCIRNGTARVQFLLKTSAALTVRMGLIQLASAGTVDTVPSGAGLFITAWGANTVDPTLGTNLAYIAPIAGTNENGTISGNALSCACTTSWQRFGASFTVPNTAHNLIPCIWTDSQFTAGQSVSIAEAGVYEGPEIRTSFVPFASAEELLRCMKFYQKTFPLATAPAQNAGVTGALRTMVAIAGAVATSSAAQWRFGAPMRVAPVTTTFYNPSAANAFARNVPAATDATATAAASATEFGLDWNCTGLAAWTVGQELKVHCTVDSEL